jgi:hypothetical protein
MYFSNKLNFGNILVAYVINDYRVRFKNMKKF